MVKTKTKSTKPRPRTYARNRIVSRRGNEIINERDSVFFLKLVTVVLLGTLWIKFRAPIDINGFVLTAIPAGTLIAFIFVATFEKIQLNRKIWYAILIVVTIVCYFIPSGIVI